jgi:hypothetical protein
MKGCALAAIKKNSRKANEIQKQKSKRKRGEPKAKPDIVLDAILLRRPRSTGPFPRAPPRFPEEKENCKREKSRAADEDTKDKEIK